MNCEIFARAVEALRILLIFAYSLGDCIDANGQTLNDCHAEVLARRGLLKVIYLAISNIYNNAGGENLLFAKVPSALNKLQLRPGLTLHLYISTAPCGDGRVFTLR